MMTFFRSIYKNIRSVRQFLGKIALIGLVVAAAYSGINSVSLYFSGASTTGTVVDSIYKRGGRLRTKYSIVEFSTAQNKTYTVTTSQPTFGGDYELSDKVEVLYNPKNPQEADVNTFWNIWFAPLFALSFIAPFIWSTITGRANRKPEEKNSQSYHCY